VKYPVAIPKLGSLLLKHDLNAPMAGLDTIPREGWPPAAIVFWSFRIMVGLGLLMMALGVWRLVARMRSAVYRWKPLHIFALVMGPSGIVAVLAGWVTTEVGRQPYTVYGLLRTSDSMSPIDAPAVATSLIVFIVVYFIVFGVGFRYL